MDENLLVFLNVELQNWGHGDYTVKDDQLVFDYPIKFGDIVVMVEHTPSKMHRHEEKLPAVAAGDPATKIPWRNTMSVMEESLETQAG